MGIYVDPGNGGFAQICRGGEYVDKTGLIAVMNRLIDGPRNLVCISRPRRFGKSYAAKMLAAYYDCSCDSRALFGPFQVAATRGYAENINRYHVISLDITSFLSEAVSQNQSMRNVPSMIRDALLKDIKELAGQHTTTYQNDSLNELLLRCVEKPGGRKFVFIIDEWDAMIREAKDDPQAQKSYLNLLRGWFKNSNFTPKAVAAAYMTGILPIKKDGSQSAISDFDEYSILNPGIFTEYTGFLEREVRDLCAEHGMDYQEVKEWYDGYCHQKQKVPFLLGQNLGGRGVH